MDKIELPTPEPLLAQKCACGVHVVVLGTLDTSGGPWSAIRVDARGVDPGDRTYKRAKHKIHKCKTDKKKAADAEREADFRRRAAAHLEAARKP